MTDREEPNPGSLLQIVANAWKLVRSLAAVAKQSSAPETASQAAAAESSEGREAARLRKGAWIVIGASLVWKGARALSSLRLKPSAEPRTAAAEPAQEEPAVRKEKWLMLGALLSWKAGKSLARSTAATFLEQPASESGAASAGAARLAESPAASTTPPAETAWAALQASASAVGQVVNRTLADTTPVEDLPGTGRGADRNLDRENEVNLERRERWGTLLAMSAALAGVAGGIAFVVTFWTDGRNEWLGSSAAVFLGGFGLAMVLWAHWLTAHKEAVEPRERVSSPPPEQQQAAQEFLTGAADIRRRRLLQWMGVAGLGALGSIVISLIRSLGLPPSPALETDVWKRGQRLMTVDGVPVGVDSLAPGGMIVVFPENAVGSEKTQTVLVRVRQDLVQLPPQRSDWAPGGNLAYSRICTHAGCSVGMYEANSHLLMCPCHQSTFNVLTGALPTGGPAARPLPQLPLYVDSNGHLRAADGFSDYPGPGFWGMPS
ncbi:MAG TPA: Rieske 2Fe-2S domain-containing protein [Acidobacteriaceae bacterium]|jgi:ubiquinol-cytochrome c reductase iron-sulfur subunit|nr:Rieske 2Fe-2S domain-containing protein [Acidobacteriaceae bacterium]